MGKYSVEIFHGNDCLEQFSAFLGSIDFGKDIPKEKPVLLKVNMLMNAPASSGITTDMQITKRLAYHLEDRGFDIIVGDGGDATTDTMKSFEANGYVDMCMAAGYKLVNLNKGPFTPKLIGNVPMFINDYALNSSVISVAKLKPHGTFKVTGTLKNLMGAVIPKGHMHDNFTMKIEDVYNYIKPIYGVIDGIIANGHCENIACPVRLNTILCGETLPYIDKVESLILERQAEHIENLFHQIKEPIFYDSNTLNKIEELYRNGGLK